MKRTVGAISSGVVAILIAAAALLGASAQAEEGTPELRIGAAPAVIRGLIPVSQNHVFGFRDQLGGAFTIHCGFAYYEGTTSAKSVTELTVTPSYSQCQQSGTATTVKMNGCKYTLKWTAALTATLNIANCTTGKVIEIEFGKCLINIPEQNGLAHVKFQNVAATPKHLLDKVSITKMSYQQVGALACPGGNSTQANGELLGETTVKAYEYKAQKQVQDPADLHQYNEFEINGTQVSLEST